MERTFHLANICRNKNKSKDKSTDKSTNFVKHSETHNINDYFRSFYSINVGNSLDFSIHSIAGRNHAADHYELSVEINGIRFDAMCDTGAPCSLMSISIFDSKFNRNIIRPCAIPYEGYNGDLLDIIGEFDAFVNFEGQKIKSKFVITNTQRPTLIGRDLLRGLGFELIKQKHNTNSINNSLNKINYVHAHDQVIDQIKTEFANVFKPGLGTYNGSLVHLSIKPNTVPIFRKPYPVPLAWRCTVEDQLNDLVKLGVLIPCNDSEWGTCLVPVLKPDGQLRLCGSYKETINRYLLSFQYPLPRIDQIFASMQGGQLFTKLDLSNAYNQLVLDDESQKLCTWSTHKGAFRITRMPFGIKPAAAIFQKTIENLIGEFKNVFCYQDDIVVTGPSFIEHLNLLKKVLFKLQSAGLRLNLKKCKFFEERISYLGFNIDKNGLSENKERSQSIIDAPIPTNYTELKAFVGMVNHHSQFIPSFSEKMAPLYALLKKDAEFIWSAACQKAYEIMKSEICSDRILVHFNQKLPIILTTDASNTAVAGVLSHKYEDGSNRPIAYVSRALNNAEKNYSTIEKEALAIVYSVTKLKQYLLGTHFTLLTDHRPLLALFGEHKGIPVMAAARMQRRALILSGFDYSIEYIKGTFNIADSLSRIPQAVTSTIIPEPTYIDYIGFVNPLQIDYNMVAKETRTDPILSKLSDSINNGFIKNLKSKEFEPYVLKADELTIESGCIMWGYRTVIPCKLRKFILETLHLSHFGIVKTKALARSYIWWPNIDKEIEALVKECHSCQSLQHSPEKSSIIPWKPTDSSWKRIHIDYAGPVNNFYLFVVIDSYSKWVEVFKTKDMTTSFTIHKLRELISRFGLFDILVSDNGRQFTSDDFKAFIKSYGIKHILTAPGHPATNGQAENFVKTLKKSLIATLKSHKNDNIDTALANFLFDYRVTKHCTTNSSPAKLLFGREIKSRFSLLKPPLTKDLIEMKQLDMKNTKNKRNRTFSVGQKVFIRDYKNPNKASWSPAIIKEKLGPRNYKCTLTYENRDIKRHLDQIRDGEIPNTNNEQVIISPPMLIATDGARDLRHDEDNGNDRQVENNVNSNINDLSTPTSSRPPAREKALQARKLIKNMK